MTQTLIIELSPDVPMHIQGIYNSINRALGFRAKLIQIDREILAELSKYASVAPVTLTIIIDDKWQYNGSKEDYLKGWLSAKLPQMTIKSIRKLNPNDEKKLADYKKVTNQQ